MEEEGYLEIDIKQIAKDAFQKNETFMKNIREERLDEVFEKIHVLDTQEQFREESKRYLLSEEGFNRKDYIGVGPEATPYTIVREVLQYVTTEFSEDGQRLKNGIAQNGSSAEILLNKGLLECLATKISQEEPKNQLNKKLIFSRLEPMMISYTGNEEILLETLLNNETTIHDFVNKFANKEDANYILNSIRDIEVEKLDKVFQKMERRVKRYCLINNFRQKIKRILKKAERKGLPSSENTQSSSTPREKFIERYADSTGKKATQLEVSKKGGITPIPITFEREEETK